MTKIMLMPVPGRAEFVTRTVHEHRAPTDESVRLLREMEERARAQVIASVPLESNYLHGRAEYVMDHAQDQLLGRVIVDVNGKRVVATVRQQRGVEQREFVAALRDELARVLADEILRDAIRGMGR